MRRGDPPRVLNVNVNRPDQNAHVPHEPKSPKSPSGSVSPKSQHLQQQHNQSNDDSDDEHKRHRNQNKPKHHQDDLTSPARRRLAEANEQFDQAYAQLMDENASLKASLEARDAETQKLEDALLTLQEELEAVESSAGSQVSKDLVRKNRELMLQMGRDRKALASAQKEITELKQMVQSGQSLVQSLSNNASTNDDEVARRNVGLERQLHRSQREVESLKRRLWAMQRCIQLEIGNEVSIDEIVAQIEAAPQNFDPSSAAVVATGSDPLAVNGGPGWRGRAQTISLLKKKVREMEQNPQATPQVPQSAQIDDHEQRHVQRLQMMSADRKLVRLDLEYMIVSLSLLLRCVAHRMLKFFVSSTTV